MQIEEMRKIAEQRTKGKWQTFGDPLEDAEFIALAANTYDALLDIAEAAKKAQYNYANSAAWYDVALDKALKKLEEL